MCRGVCSTAVAHTYVYVARGIFTRDGESRQQQQQQQQKSDTIHLNVWLTRHDLPLFGCCLNRNGCIANNSSQKEQVQLQTMPHSDNYVAQRQLSRLHQQQRCNISSPLISFWLFNTTKHQEKKPKKLRRKGTKLGFCPAKNAINHCAFCDILARLFQSFAVYWWSAPHVQGRDGICRACFDKLTDWSVIECRKWWSPRKQLTGGLFRRFHWPRLLNRQLHLNIFSHFLCCPPRILDRRELLLPHLVYLNEEIWMITSIDHCETDSSKKMHISPQLRRDNILHYTETLSSCCFPFFSGVSL